MRTSGQRSPISRGRQPLEGDADGLGGRGVELELVHPRPGLRHAQVADDREAGVEAGLGLERLVELHRVVVDVAGRVAHVEERQQARRRARSSRRSARRARAARCRSSRPSPGGRRSRRRPRRRRPPPRAPGFSSPPSLRADRQCLAEAAPAQAGRADARRADCDARNRARRRRAFSPTLDAGFGAGRFHAGQRRERHENARIAGGRGARPRRLCRRAGGAADDLGGAGPDRPRRGRQPRGGRLLAGPERRPRDRASPTSSSAGSTRPATSSPSTSTRSR